MSDQDSRLSLIADSVIGACVGVIIGCAFLMLQLVQLRPSNINIGAPVVNFDPGLVILAFVVVGWLLGLVYHDQKAISKEPN